MSNVKEFQIVTAFAEEHFCAKPVDQNTTCSPLWSDLFFVLESAFYQLIINYFIH